MKRIQVSEETNEMLEEILAEMQNALPNIKFTKAEMVQLVVVKYKETVVDRGSRATV